MKKRVTKPAKPAVRRTAAKSVFPWATLSRNGASLHIEDFLTFRITRLSNALRNNLTKRYLEEFDVSLPEWRLLALITRFSPLRFAELTARSSMDKGQVSRTLQIMTRRGWIKMKAVTQRGSRSAEALAAPVVVSVTAKGKAFYKAVLPAAQRRQAEALATLTKAERLALYNTLGKLYAFIGDADQTGDEAI